MAKLTHIFFVVVLIVLGTFGIYYLIDETPVVENTSIFGRAVFNDSRDLGEKADPNYEITWPKDHASHDDFDIEWWYLTANLEDEQGNPYGMQWTLFRFRNPSQNPSNSWANEQIFMAHASIHSMNSHWFSEKFARGGVGNAGVNAEPFQAYIDNWVWQNNAQGASLFPSTLTFNARENAQKKTHKALNEISTKISADSTNNTLINATFSLKQSGPLVLHGEQGYSIKSPNGAHASHYYSAPFIDISGELVLTNKANESTIKQVRVEAWFDHEWTSQLLDTQTLGWDWLSLHLDDGSKIMAFRMRLADAEDYITGSYIATDGQQTTLISDMLALEPRSTTIVNQKALPLSWSLTIPSKNIDLTISTLKDDQYNTASVPYYEGMVSISGTHKGKGFLELTGY